MPDLLERNFRLRQRVETLISAALDAAAKERPIDVLITPNEVNNRHGTGPLLKRILRGRENLLCVRSSDEWGEHDFGAWNIRISQADCSRADGFGNVLRALRGCRVNHVFCVPYKRDELLTAVAVRELFQARLCVYLMDDQNVSVSAVPDDLMRELLEKASLRLVTHPELRDVYARKYGLSFYILPAVVPAQLLMQQSDTDAPSTSVTGSGALLGSFWDQTWFDQLCDALQGCGRRIEWYGNDRSPWLRILPEELAAAGIHPRGVVPEQQLVAELRRQPFVIVPVGTLSGEERNQGVASLSLPGRILFAAATAHTPVLVVGSRETCGSRFVEHFGLGETVPYASAALAAAMDRLSGPEAQRRFRSNAARLAARFSDEGVPEWLAESCKRGEAADSRFEAAFEGYPIGGAS